MTDRRASTGSTTPATAQPAALAGGTVAALDRRPVVAVGCSWCRSTCWSATGCPPRPTSPRRTGRSSRHRCTGATSASCSTTPRCRWRAALCNSAVVGVHDRRDSCCWPRWPGTAWPVSRTGTPDKVFYAIVGDPDDPGGGHLRARASCWSRSLGWVSSLRGLIIPTLFSASRRSSSGSTSWASRRNWRRRRRVDGLGYLGVRSGRIVVPNSLAVLRRGRRRSPSSAAGTPSCGRW